jgi:hypothetical protein
LQAAVAAETDVTDALDVAAELQALTGSRIASAMSVGQAAVRLRTRACWLTVIIFTLHSVVLSARMSAPVGQSLQASRLG